MSNVTVYIPGQALSVIDKYCEDKKVNRSKFLVHSALKAIRVSQPHALLCEKCLREPSIGEFKLELYNFDPEMGEKSWRLGKNCLAESQSSPEVAEVRRLD